MVLHHTMGPDPDLLHSGLTSIGPPWDFEPHVCTHLHEPLGTRPPHSHADSYHPERAAGIGSGGFGRFPATLTRKHSEPHFRGRVNL